jgi:hypothetical protein
LPARLVAEESYKNKAALFGATEAKPAKHMSDSSGMSKYEMPKMEVPTEFRKMTDKGVARQAR